MKISFNSQFVAVRNSVRMHILYVPVLYVVISVAQLRS